MKERINSLLHDLSVKEAKKCETEEDIEKKVERRFIFTRFFIELNERVFPKVAIFFNKRNYSVPVYLAGICEVAENVPGLDGSNRS